MADPHDWHTLDVEDGTEARQLTPQGEEDRYEVRWPDGRTVVLTQGEFDKLRGGE